MRPKGDYIMHPLTKAAIATSATAFILTSFTRFSVQEYATALIFFVAGCIQLTCISIASRK